MEEKQESVNDLSELGMESMEDIEFLKSLSEEIEDTDVDESTDRPTDDVDEIEKKDSDFVKPEPEIEEEEEQEEIVADSKKQETSTPSKNISDKLFSFASVLKEEGVLTSLTNDDKIESTEDLIEVIRKQIRENEFAGLNENQKKYLKILENGLPEEDFFKAEKQVTDLSKITKEKLEEDGDLRRQLIVDDFISKGLSKEKAEKFADISIDSGEDLDYALEALETKKNRIKEQEENKIKQRELQIENLKKQQKETFEKIKKSVFDESKEIIPGIKFNKTVANKVFENMTKPAGYTEDGRPMNALAKARMDNPEEFDQKLNTLFVLTKGFTDFTKFKNNSKTSAVKEFEDKLEINTLKKDNTGMSITDSDFAKELQSINKYF